MNILFVIAAVVVIALVAQRLLLSQSLRDVTYDAYPSKELVEPGEALELVSEVSNAKRLPELFIELLEPLPRGAEICRSGEAGGETDGAHCEPGEEAVGEPNGVARNARIKPRDGNYIRKRFYMLPRQKVTSRVSIVIPKRGIYMMRDAILRGGDFLGLRTKSRDCRLSRRIIVMPRQLPGPDISRVMGGFIGDALVKRFIMPDPVLAVGVRDYTGREPMRDIHWPSSARLGRLMAKKYEYTHEPTVTVVLNTALPPYPPRYDEAETCFSVARSVFEELERNKVKYSFITNTLSSYSQGRWGQLGDGMGRKRLDMLRGWLGCASYATNGAFDDLLERAICKTEQGRSYIIITPNIGEEYRNALDRLRALSGGNILVVTPESASAEGG